MNRSLCQLTFLLLSVSSVASGQDWCDAEGCDTVVGRRNSNDPGTLFQWRCQSPDASVASLDDPLVTDRPDFTEASSVVGKGVLQLESGYTSTFDDDGSSKTRQHSFPEMLFRYGVFADWLEFRFAWNAGQDDVSGLRLTGADDLYLGFKIGLTAQDGWRPEMALVPQMTVPSGSNHRSSGDVLAGLNWLYGWDINDFLATGGSTQFNKAIDDVSDDSYTEWAQSWTIAYSLTQRVGAYTEYFGLYPSGADTASSQHYGNGGFTYLFNNDIQFDVRGGVGLNDAADDYFVGTGMSIRFR